MTVLVTGGGGFLGSHVVDLLLEQGEAVRILARPAEDVTRLAEAGVDVHRGDMADRTSLESALAGVERVLHCAARTGPWGPPADYESINVLGLKALLEVALAAHVRRIVHVSSATVHGIDIRGTADETTPLRGGPDPYSQSKVAGERLLQQMIRDTGAPVSIVRPGLVYGPRDIGSFGRFAALVEQGKMVVIGSGNNHLPLIYVTDVARGIVLASTAEHAPGRAYLLVNDEPVTQNDYFNTIASELAVPRPRRHIPYRLALGAGFAAEMAGHLLHWKQPPPLTRFGVELLGGENRITINRARSELGFVPQMSLAEGVRQGIAWYRTAQRAASV
ncbi:MAG: NAD-dependent epimerase/dehydratase family protein [Chloroflexota bacterium]|nr:NAD-dependent epimerase/dehydratase family protein [Chloroflexota bacterium]